MRKCGSCYFFKTKFPVLNEEFSCSEIGTEAEDLACGDYREGRHAVESSPEIVLNEARDELTGEGAMNFNVSQKENLFNIFTDIFTIEQDTNIVLEKIKAEIEKQGYYLPFNANKVLNYSSKLTDLYLLYRMTMASGMAAYMEDIMKHTIDKLFSDPRKYHPKPRDKPFAREPKD